MIKKLWGVKLEIEVHEVNGLGGARGRGIARTSVTMILPSRWMVLLLTMLTIATPRLQRMPKEMQKPSPLMMAMI